MSKYRRKVANAKERERMKLVSEAFDKLSSVVPVTKMMSFENIQHQAPEQLDKNPVTKVSTLRCAISYINSLQRLIEDANRGVLDPSLYSLPEDEDEEMEEANNNNNKKDKKSSKKSSMSKKKKDGKKKSNNENGKAKKKRNNNNKNGSFKVRQYHASDFSARCKKNNFKPMSKAQLNLAIAKGLQNCKPIYNPPPPTSKKIHPIPLTNFTNSPTLQLIQLRPLEEHLPRNEDVVSLHPTHHGSPNLEVFLTASPGTSSSSSLMASSPNSTSGSSTTDSCFNTILEEPNILDDIQAVLMDADNFDILVWYDDPFFTKTEYTYFLTES